jgi:hypothetical protein
MKDVVVLKKNQNKKKRNKETATIVNILNGYSD